MRTKTNLWLAVPLLFLYSTLAAGESAQSQRILTISGGEVDPAFPRADVYIEKPEAAEAPPGTGCVTAERYVELINSGQYLGAAALFADDATFLEPMRPSLHGRAEIDNFYSNTIGKMQPHVIPVAYLGDSQACMVVLATKIVIDGKDRYALASVNHFVFREEGKVGSMVAFARPTRELD